MIENHKSKNRIEFLEIIESMFERKYENVNINLKIDELEVEYDLNTTVTKQNYITVTAPMKKPVSAFTINKASGKHPLTVTFTYTGIGGTPDSYLWNFGDKATSTTAITTSHTYTKAGTYTVSLRVTNSTGSSTTTKAIKI